MISALITRTCLSPQRNSRIPGLYMYASSDVEIFRKLDQSQESSLRKESI